MNLEYWKVVVNYLTVNNTIVDKAFVWFLWTKTFLLVANFREISAWHFGLLHNNAHFVALQVNSLWISSCYNCRYLPILEKPFVRWLLFFWWLFPCSHVFLYPSRICKIWCWRLIRFGFSYVRYLELEVNLTWGTWNIFLTFNFSTIYKSFIQLMTSSYTWLWYQIDILDLLLAWLLWGYRSES